MSAAQQIITLQSSEVGVRLRFTVKRNGVVLNLTGATVKFYVDGLTAKTCSIPDPTLGRADYVVQTGDFPAGYYAAQLEAAFPGGVKFRSQRLDLRVETAVA